MSAERRQVAAATARRLAWLFFCGAIVLSPTRAAVLVVEHRIPPLYGGYTDLLVPWSGLVVLATLACWGTSLILDRRPIDLGPRALRWPAAALVALGWASAVTSIDPAISVFAALTWTALAGLALYALNEVRSLDRLVVPVAIMVALEAVVGLAQVASQGSVGLGLLGELRLDPSVRGVSVVASGEGGRLLRAYGLTDHPNILGGLLVLALPILAIGLAGARRRSNVPVVVVIGLAVAALVLTFSRAAWLAAGFEVVVALAVLARGGHWSTARRWGMTAMAAGVLGVAIALPYAAYLSQRADIAGRGAVTELMSTGERVILAREAAAIALAHPLVGTGLGTFPLALLRARPSLSFDYQPAPVVELDAAAELGVPGAAAFAVLLVAPWLALWRRRDRWTPQLAAASAALAAATLVGFLDYYTWTFPAGRTWAALLLGLWGVAYAGAAARRPVPVTAGSSYVSLARDPADARA